LNYKIIKLKTVQGALNTSHCSINQLKLSPTTLRRLGQT